MSTSRVYRSDLPVAAAISTDTAFERLNASTEVERPRCALDAILTGGNPTGHWITPRVIMGGDYG